MGAIHIQGEVVFAFRENGPTATRGIYLYLYRSKNSPTGIGYLDLDELPSFIRALDKLSQDKQLVAIRDSYLSGGGYRSRSGVFFRTSNLGADYVIGAWSDTLPRTEVGVPGITDAELAEFKLKLDLARKWAEAQTP